MSVPRYDQYPLPALLATRTCGLEDVSTSLTFANWLHAFIWLNNRALRSPGGLSRNPTVSRTPEAGHLFPVSNARCSSVGITGFGRASATSRPDNAFAGFTSRAFRAASAQSSGGRIFTMHVSGAVGLL